jgi:hypothetical protein
MSNEEKLKKAIDYLRERNKYILDEGNTFVPTSFVDTDTARLIQCYRHQVLGDTNTKNVKE